MTRKQSAAIAGLLTLSSIRAAAESAGVHESTLRRWLALPEFQSEYQAARRSLVDAALARLQGAAGSAVDTLVALLASDDDAVRCRASTAILDRAGQAVDLEELMTRVQELERERQAKPGIYPPPAGHAGGW